METICIILVIIISRSINTNANNTFAHNISVFDITSHIPLQ